MSPSFDIVRSGHVEFLVRDLVVARRFYVDTLGFVLTQSDPNHLYLRGLEDRHHHCLVLTRSDTPGVGHISFRLRGQSDLEGVESLLKAKGCATRWVEGDEESGQGRAVRAQDPLGFPVEFYGWMEPKEWLVRKFQEHRGGRVMRLDHFNLLVPDVAAAYSWYSEGLGFGCTELTETEGAQPELWAAWLRRKPTCHDVALTTGRGPRVHHAGFFVTDRGAIMDCADVLASTGYASSIERGPGRHGISNAFFLYLRDPDGNRLELYTGDYLSADPDWEPIRWKLNDPQRQTFWGAIPPQSWFNDAMEVRDFESGAFVPIASPKLQEKPDYAVEIR